MVWLRDQLITTTPGGPWVKKTSLNQISFHSAPNPYTWLPLYSNRSNTNLFHLLLLRDWPSQSEPQHTLPHLVPRPPEELAAIAIPILQIRKLKHREGKSLSPKTHSQEVAQPASISGPPCHTTPRLQDLAHAPHSPALEADAPCYALLMPTPPAESAHCWHPRSPPWCPPQTLHH